MALIPVAAVVADELLAAVSVARAEPPVAPVAVDAVPDVPPPAAASLVRAELRAVAWAAHVEPALAGLLDAAPLGPYSPGAPAAGSGSDAAALVAAEQCSQHPA